MTAYNQIPVPNLIQELLDPDLRLILSSVYRAGQYAVQMRATHDLDVRAKSTENFVTVIDTSNQDYLVTQMNQLSFSLSSSVGYILEEDTELSARSAANGTEDMFIYIDPIDGTTAFKDGGDAFCVGISVERRNGEVLYAVVYIPSREKAYVLTHQNSEVAIYDFDKMEGGRSKYIEVKQSEPQLLRSVAAHYNPEKKDELLRVYSVLAGRPVLWHTEVVSTAERFGSNPVPGSLIMDLTDLAQGRYDVVINWGAHLWDIAAARHMLYATGYKLVDWSGKDIDVPAFKGQDRVLQLVAGKPAAIDAFFAKLKQANVKLT